MQFLVAINCSSRKTAAASRLLCARSLARGDVRDLADQWRERRSAVHDRIAAGRLYDGRAFAMGLAAAQRLRAEVRVISAGMGLLRCDSEVAPYSLTIAPDTFDCVLDRAWRDRKFTASQWWQAIRDSRPGARPLGALLRRHSSALLIISVTGPYMQMIADELSDVRGDDIERVRIVGPSASSQLPESIRHLLMPYDARLNDRGLDLRGTAFDFAARAVSHFAELLQSDSRISSAAAHARRVRQSLARRRAPARVERVRINDTELRRTIRGLWRAGLSRTAALPHLRRSLGLACQAERFGAMWFDEVGDRG